MTSFDRALRTVLRNIPKLRDEKVPIRASRTRVLSEDIIAPACLPAWDNSAMDGFAVNAADLAGATRTQPVELRVRGESSAGGPFKKRLKAGETVRVMTGGIIPDGADAVVPIEEVGNSELKRVLFGAHVVRGACIRKAGEDVRRGEKVIASGAVLRAPHIGLLTALGYRNVRVHRRPVINILSTGDELVESGKRLKHGMIYNSTSHALVAYVEALGGIVQMQRIVADRRKLLMKSIAKGLDCDILLLTGGVSKGSYDFVAGVLESCGVETLFHGVDIKPGKPLLFGRHGKTLVFGLPGNPVSTCVTFLQFVKPAIMKMYDSSLAFPHRLQATLHGHYHKRDSKRHFLRGTFQSSKDGLSVGIAANQSSGALSSLVKANCLIVIPEKTRHIRAGELVEIELLDTHGLH